MEISFDNSSSPSTATHPKQPSEYIYKPGFVRNTPVKKKHTVGLVVFVIIVAVAGGAVVYNAVTVNEPVASGMVRIAGGTFMMGSSPAYESELRDRDEVQHQVTVSGFSIGNMEVTQNDYQAVMGENHSYFKGDNLPVESVTWYNAVVYCNARSRKEGLTPAYIINGTNVSWNQDANGYRLPTEAEWEYACRAGTITPYSSGSSVDNAGWYNSNSGRKTHPVGTKQANAWGLYDMHGNVGEWCWDWYGDYSSANQTDPTGAASGFTRVLRGGSWGSSGNWSSYDWDRDNYNWDNSAALLRSANRGDGNPKNHYNNVGFRVVRP
ncbi:formylglycine-generating enzyme family protein [Breznakiellaceae bacterium SP9]